VILGLLTVGWVPNTTAPDPVFVVICVPLIYRALPVPAVSNVLFVKVAVVAPVINVPVSAGRVKVPDADVAAWTTVLPVDPLNVAPPELMDGVVRVGEPSNTNLPVPVAPVEVTPSTVTWPPTVNGPVTSNPEFTQISEESSDDKESTARLLLVLMVTVDVPPGALVAVLMLVPPTMRKVLPNPTG